MWTTKLEDNNKNKLNNQFTSFQRAMKVVIIWGQCIGLNPVTGILQKDVSKIRFTRCSIQYLLAVTLAVAQTIGTILTSYRLYKKPSNISAHGFVAFFMTACLTTISFIRIAPKWPLLMNELINSNLDEYIQPKVVRRCKIACAVFMAMALRVGRVYECHETVVNYGEMFLKVSSPWLYELDVPYIHWVAIIIQYLNSVATATWNYADIFIVCISLYLTSIMEQINKKIVVTASKNFVPASTWGVLREDYNRASKLVKLFDDLISGLVLIAFANDLFFICLQLYNVLANGIRSTQIVNKLCPGHEHNVFRIYIYPAYLIYSTVYLCVRFLTLALVSSGVHSASLVSLPILYAVPTTSYCKEVERFQNQVNSDTVALSGLHFFYITRDLVLTVAGTIITYELVLLQFSDDDK
ncbi:hypothetical protein PYW08_014286 [Mythimna loreyi]|uniref:Uncharacterized protein n=1 Tax=Mythimna loreyi TaxID=667449 RepID=A0ACC2R974_9NEOP|nr:hypothetical protein PYW08_014286 [Mythimna loreyi]